MLFSQRSASMRSLICFGLQGAPLEISICDFHSPGNSVLFSDLLTKLSSAPSDPGVRRRMDRSRKVVGG
jgi:hypothetical protein